MKQRRKGFADKYRTPLLLAVLLLLGQIAFSQNYTSASAWGYKYRNVLVPETLSIPADTFAIPAQYQNQPFIAFKDSLIYLWSPTLHRWNTSGSVSSTPGSGGTGGVDFLTKQNYGDTATYDASRWWVLQQLNSYTPTTRFLDSMQAARFTYLKAGDTTYIHNQLVKLTTNNAANSNLHFENGLVWSSVTNTVSALYQSPIWNANRIQGYPVNAAACNGCVAYFDSVNQRVSWRRPDSATVQPIYDSIAQINLDLLATKLALHDSATRIWNKLNNIGFYANQSQFTVRPAGTLVGDKDTLELSQPILDKINEVTTPGNFVPYPDLIDSLKKIREDLLASASGRNIANADLTMDASHTVNVAGHSLEFQNFTGGNQDFQFSLGRNGSSGVFRVDMTDAEGRIYSDYKTGVFEASNPSGDKLGRTTVQANSVKVEALDFSDGLLPSRFTVEQGGHYGFWNLPPAPVDVDRVIVYKDTTDSNGEHFGRLTYKNIADLGADGNNYVTGGNVTGSNLILHRSGLSDVSIDASPLSGNGVPSMPSGRLPFTSGGTLSSSADFRIDTANGNVMIGASAPSTYRLNAVSSTNSGDGLFIHNLSDADSARASIVLQGGSGTSGGLEVGSSTFYRASVRDNTVLFGSKGVDIISDGNTTLGALHPVTIRPGGTMMPGFVFSPDGSLTIPGNLVVGGTTNGSSSNVTSFNGRTAAVMPAANDYTFAQIGSKPTTLAGYGITDAASTSALALKLNISDTAAAFNNYRTAIIANAAAIATNSASLAAKLNTADTAAMLANYRLKDIAQDAAITNSSTLTEYTGTARPSTPAAGLTLYESNRQFSGVDATGTYTQYQPWVADKWWFNFQANTPAATVAATGTAVITVGTLANATASGATTATNMNRLTATSAATAGAQALVRANSVLSNNYKAYFRWGTGTRGTTGRGFVGVSGSVITDGITFSGLTNTFGVFYDAANYTLLYNDGAGSATTVSLNSAFTSNTAGDVFSLSLQQVPGVGMYYRMVRENGGEVSEGLITTNTPTTTTAVVPQVEMSNGGAAEAVSFNFFKLYGEQYNQ